MATGPVAAPKGAWGRTNRTAKSTNRHDPSWLQSFRSHSSFLLFWSFLLANIFEEGWSSRKKKKSTTLNPAQINETELNPRSPASNPPPRRGPKPPFFFVFVFWQRGTQTTFKKSPNKPAKKTLTCDTDRTKARTPKCRPAFGCSRRALPGPKNRSRLNL